MKPTRLIVWLLVAACVAIDLAVIGELQVRRNGWPEAGGVVGLGLSFSQVVLLSLWLVWGRSSVLLRGVGTLLGVWGISCLASYSSDGGLHRVGLWFGVLLLYCGVCVIPLVIAKLMGYELSHAAESPPAGDCRLSTNQFTIWGLLSLMTTVGITLAALRFAEFPMSQLLEVIAFVMILAATGCTILLLALFQRRLYIAIIATLLISPIAGILLSLFGPTQDNDALFLILMTFVQGPAILAAVVVLRTSGYRLIRSHVQKQPVAEITALESSPASQAISADRRVEP